MSSYKSLSKMTSDLTKLLEGKKTSVVTKRVFVGFLATLAIACQPPSPKPLPTLNPSQPSQTTRITPAAEATTETTTTEQSRYTNELFNFSFVYPNDFVLDNSQTSSGTTPEEDPQLTLDLWQREQFEQIQAGAYEGGTEYPPNVQVAVYLNRDRLPLEEWVKQSNRFVLLGELQTQTIAGQEALTFSSDGLYRSNNIVFPTANGDAIVVISGAEIGVAELDEPNQRAFEQVISTFNFVD